MALPLASLSLDLDNKWSYLKTHGDKGWASYPTYLPTVVPRILDFCSQRDLTITVFVVGKDADDPRNGEALNAIAQAGHELGNHSYHHEPWLHLYSRSQVIDEITMAEESIELVTGRKPVGFRGPGFSVSRDVLRVLQSRHYLYDASTLPTFLGPLAKAYYFMTAKLSAEEKAKRKLLFGRFREGFRPVSPYTWDLPEGELLEIPVTTMPILRTPIHASYLLYLSQFSRRLARTYFRLALFLCRQAQVAPSLLLHPLDFLGGDDDSDLDFFPAMRLPGSRKRELVAEFVEMFCKHFHAVTMQEHAASVRQSSVLPTRQAETWSQQAAALDAATSEQGQPVAVSGGDSSDTPQDT